MILLCGILMNCLLLALLDKSSFYHNSDPTFHSMIIWICVNKCMFHCIIGMASTLPIRSLSYALLNMEGHLFPIYIVGKNAC